MSDQQMDTVLAETRKFPPPEDFSSKAHIRVWEDYKALHQRSIQDPEGFWSEVASELHWFRNGTLFSMMTTNLFSNGSKEVRRILATTV